MIDSTTSYTTDNAIHANNAGPIENLRFSNLELPTSVQFEAWRDIVMPLMELLPPETVEDGFPAEIKAWDLEQLILARSTVPACRFVRDNLHIRNNNIDHWCLFAARSGSARTTSKGRMSFAEPGTLLIQSMHTPIEGTMTHSTGLCVFVPRDFCREIVAALDAVDGTGLTSGLAGLLADYMVALNRQLRWLTKDDLPGILAVTRAMIDACVLGSSDAIEAAARPIDATLLERARETVQANLLSPTLGVDELCRGLGISRSRLYRLFEELGGVVHYIRGRRLLDAHRVLSNGSDNRTIVQIAAERGFLDPADFSRSFKREFGYSPKDARQRVRYPRLHEKSQLDGTPSFGDMLRQLH